MATNTRFHQFVKFVKAKQKQFLTDLLYVFIGSFIITPIFLLYFVTTLPLMVYRAFVAFILSKWYQGHHGYRKMVSPGFSTAYAVEYLSSLRNNQQSRNTILLRELIEGHVPIEICKDKLENGWVKAKDSNNLWRNPELRSYVDSWMGYCYWREESSFNFNSHIHHHKTEKFHDIDQYTSNLIEKLLNTPFIPNRSPWDVYIIHGWKPEKSTTGNNNTLVTNNNPARTILIIRTHHVLGDGNSLAYLIFRDLFGIFMNGFDKQADNKTTQKEISLPQKIKTAILTITKLMWDFGSIATFVLWKAKANTKLHVKNTQGLRYVHHMSSSLVSMDTVKNIAENFQVSFSGVVFSSMTSALAKSLDTNYSEKFLLAAPRPLSGHATDRMVNHLTGSAYNVPGKLDMHPVQRLVECDKIFKMVNKSLFPTHVFPVLVHFLSYHIFPVAKFGFKSRQFGASLSNNMTVPAQVRVFENKYKLLEHSGTIATYDGATGLVIVIISYANEFRLHGVANCEAFSKEELELFIEYMITEINDLTKAANSSSETAIANLKEKTC